MREILFRAKLLFNEKIWVYGSFVEEDYDEYPQIISNGDGGMYEVICETLGQYIGLLDKNGKKIFEGDIVRDPETSDVGLIYFDTDTARFVIEFEKMIIDFSDYNNGDVEVIGNIYDDPELTGEKNER